MNDSSNFSEPHVSGELVTPTEGGRAGLAPIVLFVFARPNHTARTLSTLRANKHAAESDLIVYADGSHSESDQFMVEQVRALVRAATGFRTVRVIERAQNLGLAQNIIDGVSTVCASYGRVIVLEDDLVTSPWFLSYMNQALDLYAEAEEVASVHGYSYPTRGTLPANFFLRGADCWGWGTWSRAWRRFNPDGDALLKELEKRHLTHAFDMGGAYGFTELLRAQVRGEVNSWAVRWHATMFLANMLTLYPGRSLVQNIGHDLTGTHCSASQIFAVSLQVKPVQISRIPLIESSSAKQEIAKFLRGARPTWFTRIKHFLTHRFPAF